MVPVISLIMCSRVEGNENHNLEALLDSLQFRTANPSKVEVLIKFDRDDKGREDLMEKLVVRDGNRNWPFMIKTRVTSRRKGYADLHHGYQDLLPYVHPDSRIVGAVADDFICVCDGWDNRVREVTRSRNIFVVHAEPVSLDFNVDEMDKIICDESPFWSRDFLHFAHKDVPEIETVWPIYATDAWTMAIEKCLKELYGVNVGVVAGKRIFQRVFCPSIDGPLGPRFKNERREMFEYTKSGEFKGIIEHQAANIAKTCLDVGP